MQAAQKAFILLWTATAIVVIALMVLLYVSLIPHFGEIGDAMIWVVRIGLACGTILMLTFTYSWVGRLLSKRKRDELHQRLIVHGDVAAYIMPDGKFEHLSARHEEAKAIPQVALSKQQDQEPLPSEAWVILDMHWQGIGFKRIAEATKWREYEVRKLCNRVDAQKPRAKSESITQEE